MAGNIEIPFAVGSSVWRAEPTEFVKNEDCPDCGGEAVVSVVTKRGSVSVDCGACARGFDGSLGYITRRSWAYAPKSITLRRVEVRGLEILYSESPPDAGCYSMFNANDLYADREACVAACAVKAKERAEQEQERVTSNLTRNRADKVKSVPYWQQFIARLEKDLAAAKDRLARCPRKKVAS